MIFFVYKYLMDGETPVAPRDQMRHCQFVHFLTPTTCSFLSRPAQCSSLALYNAHHKWMRTLCRCIWDLGREGESRKDSFKFYTRSHDTWAQQQQRNKLIHEALLYLYLYGDDHEGIIIWVWVVLVTCDPVSRSCGYIPCCGNGMEVSCYGLVIKECIRLLSHN